MIYAISEYFLGQQFPCHVQMNPKKILEGKMSHLAWFKDVLIVEAPKSKHKTPTTDGKMRFSV